MSIDFATAPPQVHDFPVLGSKRPDIDFNRIAEAALAQAETLLARWFPAGRLEGREFVVGDGERHSGQVSVGEPGLRRLEGLRDRGWRLRPYQLAGRPLRH